MGGWSGALARQRSKVSYLPLLVSLYSWIPEVSPDAKNGIHEYSLNPARGTVAPARTRDNPRAMTTGPLSLSL